MLSVPSQSAQGMQPKSFNQPELGAKPEHLIQLPPTRRYQI